ncbi:hypothetical protein ACVWXO_007401 [Bradyrhizobium sp. LM2.7]
MIEIPLTAHVDTEGLARISHTALAKWPGFAVLVVDFCAGARPRGSVCRGILGHFHDSEGLFLWALDHAA